MRGIFLFIVSAMLAVVIGCVDQAANNEANTAPPPPPPRPGVSLYPLSTPPPVMAEAQPQQYAQPVATPYTGISSYGTTSPSPYATTYASPYTTTYAQPVAANAPVVFPDPPSVVLPPSGSGVYVTEPFAIPGDTSPVSSPYDNVVMTPPPQTTTTYTTQPQLVSAPVTYQAPAVTYQTTTTTTYAAPAGTYTGVPATTYTTTAPAPIPVPVTTTTMAATYDPSAPVAQGGYRLVPAPDIPPGNRPGDFAPSQWFEIVRPGDAPMRIGRVSSSCVCVGVRVPKRTIGQGERALIEARILSKPARNNLTYVMFVNVAEPQTALLDADVTISW